MEEIIAQLKDKAGLTDEQAIKAIEVLKEFIHSKVPPMFSGFVDNFFAAGNNADDSNSFLH